MSRENHGEEFTRRPTENRYRRNVVGDSTTASRFRSGILHASTPIPSQISFIDPLDATFSRLPQLDDHLNKHYCPKTYSKSKTKQPRALLVEDGNGREKHSRNFVSLKTIHKKAEKDERFHNLKCSFSKSSPSPERSDSPHRNEDSDWLLFRSPVKIKHQPNASPSKTGQCTNRNEMKISSKKKVRFPVIKQQLSTSRKNQKSTRGRLPVKVRLCK